MATTKNIFLLVNTEGGNALQTQFGDSSSTNYRYCDWDLDSHGNIKLISKQEATVQSTLKNIFTEKQNSGYGTNIYSMIGEKDIVVKRTSLLMDLSMAIIAQKSFNDSQAVVQDLQPEDLISSIGKFVVMEDPKNVSSSIVKLTLITNASTQVTVGVL